MSIWALICCSVVLFAFGVLCIWAWLLGREDDEWIS